MKGRLLKYWICAALLLAGVLCCAPTLQAQHYVGVRGGWGMGTARYYPQQEMGYQMGLVNGGVSYKFYGEQLSVGAVQVDLQFAQRGYNYLIEAGTSELFTGDMTYFRTINAVELPIMWQPHFYFFERKARFFLNLGTQFSYNISSRYGYEDVESGATTEGDYEMVNVRDNRFGYGLCGGAGLTVLTGRWDITLEGRYNFGYSDVLRTYTEYADNPVRSPLDQINISLGLYYRLGQGGLRAAPSKKMQAALIEAEAARIIRERAEADSTATAQPIDSTATLESELSDKITQEPQRPPRPQIMDGDGRAAQVRNLELELVEPTKQEGEQPAEE